MSTNLIATVSKSTIHSLAHQGILVCESFHQIRDLVRSHFGDAYALLFAEPSVSKDGSAIDWYTPVQGTAKRMVDLPEEEQKTARAATVRMAQDLARVAADLKQSGLASQLTRGTILELALQYPDESCIYVVGEQPIFTCWGFGPGTPGVQPQNLTRLGQITIPPKTPAPLAAPASQAASPEGRRGAVSLLWLLPLLMLPLLFFLLTASFGNMAPLIPGFNFKMPALPFGKTTADPLTGTDTKLSVELDKLRVEIRDLEKKLFDRAEQCPPEAITSDTPMLDQERELLVIPEMPSDLFFLRGQWQCDRGLFSKTDGQPLILLYNFDSNGKGTATTRQKGREDCVGPAVASINTQGLLIIEVERQVCPNGRSYSAETIECTGNAINAAMCRGKSAQGTDWGESVPFHRVGQ